MHSNLEKCIQNRFKLVPLKMWSYCCQEIFSVFGDPLFWGFLAIVLYVLFINENVKAFSKAVLIFLVVDTIFVLFTKMIFATQRPLSPSNDRRLFGPLKYSFPSGHASVAFGILIVLVPLFLLDGNFFNLYYLLFSTTLTVFVCLSRIKLNKHYPNDIYGGILVSLFLSLPLTILLM